MRSTRTTQASTFVLFLAIAALGTTGCEQRGPLEEVGESIDEGIEETGEAIEDAREEVEDVAEEVGEAVEEAADDIRDR